MFIRMYERFRRKTKFFEFAITKSLKSKVSAWLEISYLAGLSLVKAKKIKSTSLTTEVTNDRTR